MQNEKKIEDSKGHSIPLGLEHDDELVTGSFDKWIDDLMSSLGGKEDTAARDLDAEDQLLVDVTGLPIDEVQSRRFTFCDKLDFFLVEVLDQRYYEYRSVSCPRTVLEFDNVDAVWNLVVMQNGMDDEIRTFNDLEDLQQFISSNLDELK